MKRGVQVYQPIGAQLDVDLAVDVGGKLYKVQVKTSESGGKAEFRTRRADNKLYSPGALDLYAVVGLDPPRVALIPFTPRSSILVDFDNLRPEWDFDYVIERMREGGVA
jgi:hypothetical protein